MRQLWPIVLFVGSGCNSLLGIDELTRIDGGSDPTIDSAFDASSIDSIDSPPMNICAMLVAPAKCYSPLPTGAVLIETTVNTDNDGRCLAVTQTAGPALCAIIGDTITVSTAGATVTGSKPLLLVATTAIRIDGVLDAGSSITGTPRSGPGASPVLTACGTLPTAGGGSDGAGGGAGGSFTTKGGNGGTGAGNGGGNGAAATAAQTTMVVRPGCRGSAGGRTGGSGGLGGGAIYLVAGSSITISNRLIANGAGGTGGTSVQSGGGGGGSGGMIVLDAPTITLGASPAEISANGGGGGEGTFNTDAREGEESPAWDNVGNGGNGQSDEGGAGGDGSTAVLVGAGGVVGTSSSSNIDGAGGGGGGGAGLVWIKGTVTGPSSISPPPVFK